MASDPIPAATLILARDTEHGPETLMVRRTARMAFAAGAWVWPGGRIDADDHALSGIPAPTLAAVRELLEEAGLPIALVPTPGAALAAQLQEALLGGATLPSLLAAHGLSLEPEALVTLSRWAPEIDLKRRFDTWFLLARAPADLPPVRPQESEVAEARWVRPQAMLDAIAAGEAHAIFPTLRNLERLAKAADVEAMLADARAYPPTKIVPRVEDRGGEPTVCIPEGLGYPVTAVPRSEAFRGQV